MPVSNRKGDQAIGLQQNSAVIHDAWDERTTAARFSRDHLRGGEALGVLLEPFQTEKFSADRLFQIGKKNG
jgi:hypothetical protein